MYDGDDAIIDDPDEFIADIFPYFVFTFFLNRSDALSFDENLVCDGWQSQDSPCRAVIFGFFSKNFLALGNDLFVLLLSFNFHSQQSSVLSPQIRFVATVDYRLSAVDLKSQN